MIRSAIAYIASSAASRAIGLLLLPVVTRYLAPEDYGIWAVYSGVLAIIGCFVGLNLHGNITRKFFRLASGELPGYAGSVLLVLAGSFLVVTAVWIAALAAMPLLPGVQRSWLLVLPAVAAAQMIIQVEQTFSRCREQAGRFAVVEIGLALTAASVSLPLLIAYGWGWQAPAAGLVASCTLWAALALARLRLRNEIAWSARAADVREILVVSLPQIPHLLGFIVLTNSDRLLLGYFLGSSAAGVYAIGFTLATPVLMLSEGVFKAWTPWLFRTLETRRAGPATVTTAARGALLAVGALAALALVYVVLMRIAFPFLVDQRYAEAAAIFPVLAVAFWMRAIYQVAFSLLLYAGNTAPLAKANVIAAAVNVAVNLVLIPVLGLWSAPVALLSGFATLAAVSFVYQMRHFPVPWRAALRPQ